MKLEQGNMWSIFDLTDYFIITTNSYIRNDGAVVMGRGIAAQMKQRFPNIPYEFGKAIKHMQRYYLKFVHLDAGPSIGAFQVKRHFADAAELPLIIDATAKLTELANATAVNNRRFDLNFPGIGNGRLNYDDVLPIIQQLPDNVHVWTFN